MGNISVHRYQGKTGYQGWIEPEDRTWIIFIADDGTVLLFDKRDPETGALM